MKKSYLLSLIIALCYTIQCWAEFSPETVKMYALKENTTGLYLDIQTLGVHESGHTTNSISLNANPCVIYFEAGANGTWKLKNINGTYASNVTSGRNWNTTISSTAYDWTIAEADGLITIAKDANNFIGWDNNKTITAGSALYNNAEGGNTSAARLYFELVEYTSANLSQGYYSLKSATGTYFNFTPHNDLSTAATFQDTPSYLKIIPSVNILIFEDKDEQGKYISTEGSDWDVTTSAPTLWEFNNMDETGFGLIQRYGVTSEKKSLGSDDLNINAGTGIFTNVSNTGCNKWYITGIFDYPTDGTTNNGKIEFTSGKIYYYNPCNTIRFTLTESGAFFKNGTKRMSLEEFYLYDAKGTEVKLDANNVTGNNNKTYEGMFDRKNGTFAGTKTWNDGTEDDWFEILLPEDVVLGGAFSFKFVTENTTMNAKAFKIETFYQEITTIIYSFAMQVPDGKTAEALYDGTAIAQDQTFKQGKFDLDLFTATEIAGYTWKVVVDDENATITIVYTEAPSEVNPQSVVDLVNRIGGAGTADDFKFVHDPSMNSKHEQFVLGSEEGKVLIKGTTISAITTGLGWYLNHVAKINIAWNALNEKGADEAYVDLSDLPLPKEETHVCDAKYRYYLNYCTFGYSMSTWTWKRWQQEIDWMALHGVNMPLQIVGLEEVWRKFLTMKDGETAKYGYTDEEAKAFVAGPAFTAWWGMNNLQGWGGTNADGWGGVQDDAWYTRQQTLATQILARQRELGMEPVLPGWSGMVPSDFGGKNSVTTNDGSWGNFERPHIISPNEEKFDDIAVDYYNCLKAVMGESQYYSMDPFHEGGAANATVEAYAAIYAAMEAAKAGAHWVIQQWQWDGGNQKLSLKGVPAGKLIVLDLFSDGKPEFDAYDYNGYAPQDAVFCAIPNFGGRSGLMGRLQNVTDNYFTYKAKHKTIKGIGTAPEAIEQTPVTYDLIYQLPWMNGVKPNVEEWVNNYAVARYGQDNKLVKEAWSLLRQGPLNYGADAIQGPVEDVWAARPNLEANAASAWGSTISKGHKIPAPGITYTPARRQMLIDATYKLLGQQDALSLAAGSVYESNYNYDIVEFGGAVMADYAHDLLLGIKSAKEAAGQNFASDNTYITRKTAFLNLILGMDEFRGTNLNFRLGKWTQEARDAAAEVVDVESATADWYEFNNARTLITTWGDEAQNGGGQLRDYSYRSWQGLLKDYYYPRWAYYFENGCTNPASYFFFEWNWAHGMKHQVGDASKSETRLVEGEAGYSYSPTPIGNAVDEAWDLMDAYIIPITFDGYTHYAYRYLQNDLSVMPAIVVQSNSVVDFTTYFGAQSGATLTSTAIDGTATNLTRVPIKYGIADGAHQATLTLADGTVLTFYLSVNPAYNGYYHINFGGNPTFVQKTDITDLGGQKGLYKLLGNGTGTTPAEADKVIAIKPRGTGFTLSAQGKYIQPIATSSWRHLVFTDESSEAGVFFFEKVDESVLMYSTVNNQNGNYITHYDNGTVFGNDTKANAKQFTITPATTYPFTMTPAGMATLCLPFNVKMPAGMYAYDFEATDISDSNGTDVYNCVMKVLVRPGEVLKAGTPVIVKALEDDYEMEIVMQDHEAKTNLANSLLRGNFVSQTLTQSETVKKFIFTKPLNSPVGFYRMQDEGGQIGANKCWMEWDVTTMPAGANAIKLRFEDTTDIEVPVAPHKASDAIYDLFGRKLNAPQKGVNIINGKKVVIP